MIWEFADVLGRRLVAWGLASGVAGAVMLLLGDAAWRGTGTVFLAWGAVDAACGWAARVLAERCRRRTIGDPAARERGTRRLRAMLLAGAGLGATLAALGVWLAATAAGDAWSAGAGRAITVQGGFLLLFGILHARWVPAPGPLLPAGVDLFPGSGHDGFRLTRLHDDGITAPGGRVRGALLVHGFAGSPRELRGLAAVLATNGWLVEVPRLPGHGAAFGDVAEYRLEDWATAVEEGAAALRVSGATHLVVVGHSVGGALALATAARVSPDALVLLAPFCWPVPAWQRVATPLLRVFLPPGFRLFGRMDASDPGARTGLAGLLKGMDLDDPAVVTALREARVPVSLLEQLFRISAAAAAAAPTIRVPVLAIQGLADGVSLPARTRALVARLPSPPAYLEVEAGHDLVTEASPVRDRVLATVLAFAAEVTRPSR